MKQKLNEKNLNEINHKYIWHPFTQMKDWLASKPLFIEKGNGNYLIDNNGKYYIDGISSLWCNIHGHNKKELNNAIIEQLNKISHSTMLGLANIPATLLGEKLINITPPSLNKIFYSDNGATAIEIALKIAYQYWKQNNNPIPSKQKFIKLKQSYHGDTIGAVSIGGIDTFHKIFSSLLFKTFDIPTPSPYHSHLNNKNECSQHSINILTNTLKEKHNEIAGLIIEPYVQGAAGIIVFPKGFMKKVYLLCKKYNVLFIVDEVATGFGRTGKMFACQEDKLMPDIMTIGKSLTGGYLPLAATLTSNEIYNAFLGDTNKTLFHGHTYTGNPLAANVALASIKLFETENIIQKLKEKINYIEKQLEKLQNLKCVGDIRIKGLMIGIELCKNNKTKERFPPNLKIGQKICNEIRKKGVILRPLGDVIVIMPPLSITKEEIDTIINALYQTINENIKTL